MMVIYAGNISSMLPVQDDKMLHPQTRALLNQIEKSGASPTHLMEAEEARVAYRERGLLVQPSPQEVLSSCDISIARSAGNMALRLYRPMGSHVGQKLAALVYYHGGGWIVGDLDTHDTLCRELANYSGCAIVAVDYRLAPEHTFPAAVQDACEALDWIVKNATQLSIDPDRIAVGGDSVGGNLASVVALTARDLRSTKLLFQLLIYPVTDMRRIEQSHQDYGHGYLLTSEMLAHCYSQYIPDKSQIHSWQASPLLHQDLSGLPPALILTAGFDPLRDEGTLYAQKLTEAGNQATLICFERQIHGFITMGKVIDEAQIAIQLCASQMRVALMPNTQK